MSIDQELWRSREMVQRFWPLVVDGCDDDRLRGSCLTPVEGLQGHRSLDLDRKYHIDYFARCGVVWTPLSTRFQAERFASFDTITLRHTEVAHLLSIAHHPGQFGAALHVQMYGTAEKVDLIVIAELAPVMRYLTEIKGRPYWLYAPDGTPFTPISCGVLTELGALVWRHEPNRVEQMGFPL